MNKGNGLFIPSSAWVFWSSVTYAVTLLVLGGAVVSVHWYLVEHGRDFRLAVNGRTMVARLVTGAVLCLLPIWTIGLVHGVLRSILNTAPLQRSITPVEFDHISINESRVGYTYKAVLRLPDSRRSFRIVVEPTWGGDLPQKGELVPAFGFSNWLGLTIDGVSLRERVKPASK